MGQEAAEGLLTVGLVACRSGLTAKALRHYDRVKLLRPAAVDGATGTGSTAALRWPKPGWFTCCARWTCRWTKCEWPSPGGRPATQRPSAR